jgi:hypothetical protein
METIEPSFEDAVADVVVVAAVVDADFEEQAVVIKHKVTNRHRARQRPINRDCFLLIGVSHLFLLF